MQPAALRSPTSLASTESDGPCRVKVYGSAGASRCGVDACAVDHFNAKEGFCTCASPPPHVNYQANSSLIATALVNVGRQRTQTTEKDRKMSIKIGTTIRAYRLQKGLSQGDIEKKTGLL